MINDNYEPLNQLGNGVTTQFSKTWNMLNASYARVYFENTTTGVQTQQTTGWTIALTDAGWTVTFAVAPPSTVRVIIGRQVSLEQGIPFRTSRGWQGGTVENSFDKVVGMVQDMREQVDRALVFPIGDSSSPVLQSAALRANKTFIFDSLGNASAGSVTGTTVSAPMIPVVNAASLATALSLLGALSSSAGSVANSNLATMAANTVKANATAGVASPTDVALALNQLIGRGASGNIAPIAIGTGLSFSGTTLNATAGGVTMAIQVFTSSGTYTPTVGMDYCLSFLAGGGGGGRGSTNGSNGGNSSFGSLQTANGGSGGQNSAGGLGGSASGGAVNISGQNGTSATAGYVSASSGGSPLQAMRNPGFGGSSIFGPGGAPNGAASSGTGYGAGGSTHVIDGMNGDRGGGAGGWSLALFSAATIGASQSVTIGAAGSAGSGAGAGTSGICIIIEFI